MCVCSCAHVVHDLLCGVLPAAISVRSRGVEKRRTGRRRRGKVKPRCLLACLGDCEVLGNAGAPNRSRRGKWFWDVQSSRCRLKMERVKRKKIVRRSVTFFHCWAARGTRIRSENGADFAARRGFCRESNKASSSRGRPPSRPFVTQFLVVRLSLFCEGPLLFWSLLFFAGAFYVACRPSVFFVLFFVLQV